MKLLRIITLFLFAFALSCSSDDSSSNIENGINKGPNLKATGKSAHAFLSADNYESIVVEIVYVEGFRPTSQTLANLKNFMEARLNKPGGISFTETAIPSPGTSPYTLKEIAAIETQYRTKYNSPNVLALYAFFADGQYVNDTTTSFTLGTAYRNTSFVIYERTIQYLSTNIEALNRTNLESTVILHEFCHLLGLVNFGTPMQSQHQDKAHGEHCDNENCLMYWKTERNMVTDPAISAIPQLDANCIADLRANGGK